MRRTLDTIRTNARKESEGAETLGALERARIAYLGRKGSLTQLLRGLKDLPEGERKTIGAEANVLRRELEALFQKRSEELAHAGREHVLATEWIDVTRPGTRLPKGHLHPITKILREASAIFAAMGFGIAEGPEIETEHYNFDALNFPPEHPAREMHDTLWLRGNQREFPISKKQTRDKSKTQTTASRLLLRTHTSPVQIRYMEQYNPPIRIIIPGRVFRHEASDASHDIQFWQLEGLTVDKNISVANFKAVIQEFFSRFFKTGVMIRLRPSYFPFTEPSFEVDISCVSCSQSGCSICKQSGWLELAGAGMVHQNVLRAAGYIPHEWQGFAFGMGLDRLAMMKYKIPDIRLIHSGDIRFLEQF